MRQFLSLCFEEAARSLWFHRRIVAPALIVMVVSLTVLGAFLLVSGNLDAVLANWRERGQLQLFLGAEVDAGQRRQIEATLRTDPAVEEFNFIDPDSAARLFREDFPELGSVLDLLEDNPLPSSYAVSIAPEMRSEARLEALSARLRRLPGVEGVQYDLEIIGRLELGVRAMQFIGFLLGGTVLLAAVVSTANVIRVLVVSRRDEVDTMRLVGASESLVMGRFLMEGALQGAVAGLASLLLLYAAFSLGVAYLDRASLGFLSTLPFNFLDLRLVVALVGGGALTGVIGSWLALGPGGLRGEV